MKTKGFRVDFNWEKALDLGFMVELNLEEVGLMVELNLEEVGFMVEIGLKFILYISTF